MQYCYSARLRLRGFIRLASYGHALASRYFLAGSGFVLELLDGQCAVIWFHFDASFDAALMI